VFIFVIFVVNISFVSAICALKATFTCPRLASSASTFSVTILTCSKAGFKWNDCDVLIVCDPLTQVTSYS